MDTAIIELSKKFFLVIYATAGLLWFAIKTVSGNCIAGNVVIKRRTNMQSLKTTKRSIKNLMCTYVRGAGSRSMLIANL